MSDTTTRPTADTPDRPTEDPTDYRIVYRGTARFEVWLNGRIQIAYQTRPAAQGYIDRQIADLSPRSILGLQDTPTEGPPARPPTRPTDRPIKQLQITLTEDPDSNLTDEYAERLYEIIRDLLNEDPRSQCPEDPYVALIAQLCALADVDPGYPNKGTLRQQWIGYTAEWQTQYHPDSDAEQTHHDRTE